MHPDLDRLATEFWDALLSSSPTAASLLGDHRFDDRSEDLSREAEDDLIAKLDTIVARTEAVTEAGLSLDDRVTRACLLEDARAHGDTLRSRFLEFHVDPMQGPHMDLVSYIPQLTPTNTDQAEAMVARAAAHAVSFGQAAQRLREGLAAGRTPVHTLVAKSLDQLADYLGRPIAEDPYLQIAPPPSMDEATVSSWREATATQVRDHLRPAVERYRDLVRDEVLPAARPDDKAGVCWLPDGEEIYGLAVRKFTTLELSPDEIHRIGRDEIASLGDEYRELGGPVLGTTDLTEIYDRLRHDPALRFTTSAEVRGHAEQALARANEATTDWFGRLPKAPCVLREIPSIGAGDSTLAYYLSPAEDGSRPGIFFINVTAPETRTRYESEALAFHESVPGHHLQLAISQELEGVPAFRRHSLQTAMVEGWGLYTERLADEMGLYSGDVERMGILSFDSWRAGRLVVDTGMHAKGWSRRQAIDYLTANSPQAPNNIVNEVDRYIGWPGQALAYKIGQRHIMALRAEARRTLGDRFDIKAFHDALLGSGNVPLPVLDMVVEEWLATA